jgi:hypothetical protein
MNLMLPPLRRANGAAPEKAPKAIPLPATRRPRAEIVRTGDKDGPASAIADAVGASVEHALEKVSPYSSHGGLFQADAEVEHQGADGSTTRVKLNFSYGNPWRGR